MAIGFNSPATSANINNNMASKTANNTYTGDQTFSGAVNVDVISEKTAAAGVTVDGVLLKDGLTDGVDVSVLKSDFDAHIVDAVDAHDASAISNVASGNLAATDVQSALNELQSDIDTRALTSGKLSQFATTSSSELAGVISDETGSGALVFGTSPTLTTPSTDIVTLDGQASTPSNPSSGFYKLYAKDDGKAYLLNSSGTETQIGSGSGSGGIGINYITNSDAETDTTGWAVYSDAAGSSPVDGTGGSANITWTRSLTSPLIGTASFVLTKDAANRQGQGASYDFTIDSAYQAKMLRGTFNYSIASGTFADDDVQLWVYDVTNAALIALVPFNLKNHTLSSEVFSFEFQTAYNSTSYRLIFHVASTSASAYSLKFDNIQVGPQVARGYGNPNRGPVGSIIQHASLTPPSGYLYCDGSAISRTDYAELFAVIGTTYGVGDGSTTFNIPDGRGVFLRGAGSQTIGAETYSATLGTKQNDAFEAHTHDNQFGIVSVGGSYNYLTLPGLGNISLAAGSTGGLNMTSTGGTETRPANVAVAYHICYTSAGSAIQSTDAANGVVAATMSRSTSQNTSDAVYTKVNFDVSVFDNSGIVDTANNRIVFKSPGSYVVRGKISYNASSAIYSSIIALIINGVDQNKYTFSGKNGTGTAVHSNLFFYRLDNIKAGDYVEIKSYQDSGGSLNILGNDSAGEMTALYVELLQGPSQVLASADVSARYTNGATLTIPNDISYHIIDFGTKTYDSHGSVTGAGTGVDGNWKFTAMVAGTFEINACVLFNPAAYTDGDVADLRIFKLGSNYSCLRRYEVTTTATEYINVIGTDKIKLLAGEYIDIRVKNTRTGGNTSIINDSTFNYVAITKVGNY